MKTVLHVITDLGDGGAQAALYRLCLAVEKDYRQIVVSLCDLGRYGPMLIAAGIETYCLNMPRGKIHTKGLRALYKVVKKNNIDVVQTWMYHANLVGGLVAYFAGNRRIVWSLHHGMLTSASSYSSRMVNRVSAVLSGFIPRRIVCVSKSSALWHVSVGYRDQIVVIPNGCDPAHFTFCENARKEFRQSIGLGAGLPLIGMVARWTPEKDHLTLLRAVKELSDRHYAFKCILVGQGCTKENDELQGIVRDLNILDKVIFIGPQVNIKNVMNGLDVHVLSSSHEAFGMVTTEAMACTTPCAVTDVGDNRAIVGSTGWVVPKRAPSELADALAGAFTEMGQPAVWSARRESARSRVLSNYSLSSMRAAYVGIWDDVVHGR